MFCYPHLLAKAARCQQGQEEQHKQSVVIPALPGPLIQGTSASVVMRLPPMNVNQQNRDLVQISDYEFIISTLALVWSFYVVFLYLILNFILSSFHCRDTNYSPNSLQIFTQIHTWTCLIAVYFHFFSLYNAVWGLRWGALLARAPRNGLYIVIQIILYLNSLEGI